MNQWPEWLNPYLTPQHLRSSYTTHPFAVSSIDAFRFLLEDRKFRICQIGGVHVDQEQIRFRNGRTVFLLISVMGGRILLIYFHKMRNARSNDVIASVDVKPVLEDFLTYAPEQNDDCLEIERLLDYSIALKNNWDAAMERLDEESRESEFQSGI